EHQCDALVVGGEEPRLDPALGAEVVGRHLGMGRLEAGKDDHGPLPGGSACSTPFCPRGALCLSGLCSRSGDSSGATRASSEISIGPSGRGSRWRAPVRSDLMYSTMAPVSAGPR